MIIRLHKPGDNYQASFANDPTLTEGYGRSEAEAIGNLILNIVSFTVDDPRATDNIDLRIERHGI